MVAFGEDFDSNLVFLFSRSSRSPSVAVPAKGSWYTMCRESPNRVESVQYAQASPVPIAHFVGQLFLNLYRSHSRLDVDTTESIRRWIYILRCWLR
jgi:hypothetical protein